MLVQSKIVSNYLLLNLGIIPIIKSGNFGWRFLKETKETFSPTTGFCVMCSMEKYLQTSKS